jgi:hypothetical protein
MASSPGTARDVDVEEMFDDVNDSQVVVVTGEEDNVFTP